VPPQPYGGLQFPYLSRFGRVTGSRRPYLGKQRVVSNEPSWALLVTPGQIDGPNP
jgi:hypothetical protein